MAAERIAFEQEVRELEQRWKVKSFAERIYLPRIDLTPPPQGPRYARIKRPYTAAQVVSKRGTIPISYPSDIQGKKLWKLLTEHWKTKTPSHTYGA